MTLVPWFLIVRAEKQSNRCFQGIHLRGEGDPRTCAIRGGGMSFAAWVPWFAADVRHLRESSALKGARLAFDLASAIAPDALRRDEAARNVLTIIGDRDPNERASVLTAIASAHDVVARFGLEHPSPEIVTAAFRSARAIADLETLGTLAAMPDEDATIAMHLRRGAALCLLGRTQDGAREFVAADAAEQRQNPEADGNGLARLGLLACGHPQGIGGEIDAFRVHERYRPALVALHVGSDVVGGFGRARALLEDKRARVGGQQRLRLAPFVLRETRPSALEALRLLAPTRAPAAGVDLSSLRTPWTMLDIEVPTQAVYIDTRVTDLAGEHLLKIANDLRGRPLDCSGEECPDPTAMKVPEMILREGARMIWLETAAEHARLGRRDATLAAIAKASALTLPPKRHVLAPMHLLVGDADGALVAMEAALARIDLHPPAEQLRIRLVQALAFAHLGRFEEARASAEQAYAAADRAEQAVRHGEGSVGSLADLRQDRVAAAWLWSASALLTGATDGVREVLRDADAKEVTDVEAWLGLALRPEAERRTERWDLAIERPSAPALPAVMVVVGRAVPSDVATEVWLDRVFHQEAREQPVRAMLARAEAARWRADADAETRWLGRARTMLGLATDVRTALLAHILELR